MASLCKPVVLASAVQSEALAVDQTNVYYATSAGLMKLPVGGGSATLLGGTPQGALALDAANVYWISGDNVGKTPIAGGQSATVGTQQLPVPLKCMAVDSTTIYVTTVGGPMLDTVPISGGFLHMQGPVIPAGESSVTVDQTYVYWTGEGVLNVWQKNTTNVYYVPAGANAGAVTVDGTNMYWTDPTDKVIKKLAIGAPPFMGAATNLASGGTPAPLIAADGSSVFFVFTDNTTTGRMLKVPVGGGTPLTLASGGLPGAIAVDATSVYWTDTVAGQLLRVPK
jgi:hypothetical protein